MNSASLYDDDLLAWSEQQAEALRALARRPELSNLVDWENVVEEIETLGRSDFRTVTRHLELAFVHLIKMLSLPHHRSSRHWEGEVQNFLRTFQKLCTASIARRIVLDEVWNEALGRATSELWAYGDKPLPGLPDQCPLALPFLRTHPFDVQAAVELVNDALKDRNKHLAN
jgi:hypothetical protein